MRRLMSDGAVPRRVVSQTVMIMNGKYIKKWLRTTASHDNMHHSARKTQSKIEKRCGAPERYARMFI